MAPIEARRLEKNPLRAGTDALEYLQAKARFFNTTVRGSRAPRHCLFCRQPDTMDSERTASGAPAPRR